MKKTTFNRIVTTLAASLILLAGSAGCTAGESPSAPPAPAESESVAELAPSDVSAPVSSYGPAADSSTRVTLNGDSISVDGPGAEADGSVLRVTAGGIYTVAGTLTGGQILISAPATADVELRLNGVDITSSQNAAIYCEQADKLTVTLMDGTVNTLTDVQSYAYADTVAEEPDAALFCNADLEIGGSGSLTVNGNFNNGIGSKDDLTVHSGVFHITAANHGIRGRDSVTVKDGSFTVNAANDGIQSNNNEDASRGWISLEGGSYAIASGHDGIQAETNLTISGGDFEILAGDGRAGAASMLPAESYKGVKSGVSLEISGGVLKIDSADDSVHSNRDILIGGGTLTLTAGDDAIHADSHIRISGGNIDILECYEGIEGNNILISDGAIRLSAEDDGINVAGGNDGQGQDSFSSGPRGFSVAGGDVYVYSSGGDGIDMNGGGEMTGGRVIVFGSTIRGSQALDYNGSFEVTGGALTAMGAGLLTEAPGASSTQPTLLIQFARMQQANTEIAVTAPDGSQAFEYAPEKDFQTIIICNPELREGQTYAISANGAHIADATLSSAVTAINDTGAAVSIESGRRGGR